MLHMHSVDKFYDGCVQNSSKKIALGFVRTWRKRGKTRGYKTRILNQARELVFEKKYLKTRI